MNRRAVRPYSARRRLWLEKINRRWLWSIVALLCLLGLDAILVLAAWGVYDKRDNEGFASVFATGVLLNGAVVAILGVILTTALSIGSDIRTQREAEAHKRAELFRRMRDAHLRVALAQQILGAQEDGKTYHEQMRVLLEVVKDMGEIREEVKASGRLYDDVDRRLIMKGIALILIYLQKGVTQYVAWSPPAGGQSPTRLNGKKGSWVAELVADHDACRLRRDRPTDPGREDWEPEGHMPAEYDDGLEQSKLIMRAYVYGASRQELAALRVKIKKDIATRQAAEKARNELDGEPH